jgi:hypothetical protein
MQFYESEPLLRNAAGQPIARFAIFSETPRNPKPQYNVQQAVNQYVGNHEYYDFVEEWLDNPWLRVVLFGLEYIENRFTPFYGVKKYEQTLKVGDIYTGAKLIILWADSAIENPKPIIENALINAVHGASYNAFILSSLNFPWMKVVITGINNLDFEDYRGEVVNVR